MELSKTRIGDALLMLAIGVLIGKLIYSPKESDVKVEVPEEDVAVVAETPVEATEESNMDSSAGKIRQAIVVPESNFVIRGDKYKAKIYLAEIDTALNYTVFVGNRPLERDKYEFVCGSIGTMEYSGCIKVSNTDNTISEYPFSSKFTVSEPIANISSDILLAKQRNPVSISAPGFAYRDLSVSVSNGTIIRSDKDFLIVPMKENSLCRISVSALKNGKKVYLGSKSFKVVKSDDEIIRKSKVN